LEGVVVGGEIGKGKWVIEEGEEGERLRMKKMGGKKELLSAKSAFKGSGGLGGKFKSESGEECSAPLRTGTT